MKEDVVIIDRSVEQVWRVYLNRPAKRNALNSEMVELLRACLVMAKEDGKVRALALEGEGPCFCAGMDLGDFDQSGSELTEKLCELLCDMIEHPLPILVLGHGAVVAGGTGLMAAADYVVLEQNTKVGFPEVRRGIVPAMVATLLRAQVNDRILREMLMSGKLVSEDIAFMGGMANRIAMSGARWKMALPFLEYILQGGPQALAATKQVLGAGMSDQLRKVVRLHGKRSVECDEGLQAFYEKRPASWVAEEKTLPEEWR